MARHGGEHGRCVARKVVRWVVVLLGLGVLVATAVAQTPALMRFPPGAAPVPGNLMLALSVEFPTGLQASYPTANYNASLAYDGYFDRRKCYQYVAADNLFRGVAQANADYTCPAPDSQWSGNLLNWLTMTNLDQFRLVMTGGTRDTFTQFSAAVPGDTLTRTVLVRARSDRNAYNPERMLRSTDPAPASARGRFVWQGGEATRFRVYTRAGGAWGGAIDFGTIQDLQIRVEVCTTVGVVGPEGHCNTRYSGVPKPEGLVQRYADRLRIGAAAYLKDDNYNRNGAVIRAALADVRQEWNATTGIQNTNPYPVDAAASGVARSGLINYLNAFGYASGYKYYDAASELYHAALLYLRGRALPSDYSSGATLGMLDGFPAVAGADLLRGAARDPYVNQCQKSFILGLGDIYTHGDQNIAGYGGAPADDDGLSAEALWNRVADLEGIRRNVWDGSRQWLGGASNASPFMAGLAHWANTNDVRPDLPGRQSVRTYWVDVLENGNRVGGAMPAAGRLRTQYHLATKYGGFDTRLVTGDNPNNNAAAWDADSDGVPDTWFAGNNPTTLRAGLEKALREIASQAGSVVGGSSGSNLKQGRDGLAFVSGYNGGERWRGDLRAVRVSGSGGVGAVAWDAAALLDARALGTAPRRVLTHSGSAARVFTWDNLSSEQKRRLRGTDSNAVGELRLAYVAGDRSQEATGVFRARASRLGSIVNSSPLYVTPPTVAPVMDASRRAFVEAHRGRTPMLAVGSNGGMLHVFDASTTSAGGGELLAYVPQGVYAKLRDYTDPAFSHDYMVDGTALVGDAVIDAAWRTVLVGSLGLGGRGYFALDITNPSALGLATPADVVLLDNTDPGSAGVDAFVGHMVSPPALDAFDPSRSAQVVKLNNGRWAVVLGNGVNSPNGRAALLVQYLDGGRQLKAIAVGAASDSGNGLAHPRLVDLDGNGTADVAYAGDMKGQLWSFNLSAANDSVWEPRFGNQPLFTASGPSGEVQAITTAPWVMRVPRSQALQVAWGTGRMVFEGDHTITGTQSLYSVRDDLTHTRSVSSGGLTVADGSRISGGRSALVAQTTSGFLSSSTGGRAFANTSANVVDYAGTAGVVAKRGWYLDLGLGGERQLKNTEPFDGSVVRFDTTLPPSSSACDASDAKTRQFATFLDIFMGTPAKSSVFGLTTTHQSRVELGDGAVLALNRPDGTLLLTCRDVDCTQTSADQAQRLELKKKASVALPMPVGWRRLQ